MVLLLDEYHKLVAIKERYSYRYYTISKELNQPNGFKDEVNFSLYKIGEFTEIRKIRLDHLKMGNGIICGGDMKYLYYLLVKFILRRVRRGSIIVTYPNGKVKQYEGRESGFRADMEIKDLGCLKSALTKGDIGFAESYMSGEIASSNLTELLCFMTDNIEAFDKLIHGSRLGQLYFYLANKFKKNTISGSKKNIEFHYDLGNDFYKKWLDESMSYSSGIYRTGREDLHEAQKLKYERILEILGEGRKKILEIGCGWGGFAEAAVNKGHEIKGITISNEQLRYSVERLSDREGAEIEYKDYRKVSGAFDAIVSIEMFEAVGEEYWDKYFSKINELLRAGGKAVIQTILIKDEEFENYRARSDFIRQYIFPGGLLPSRARFIEIAERNGLKLVSAFSFAESYARTLSEWLKRFDERFDEFMEQGFDRKFILCWRFYLAYCIAGFTLERTNVAQFELIKAT